MAAKNRHRDDPRSGRLRRCGFERFEARLALSATATTLTVAASATTVSQGNPVTLTATVLAANSATISEGTVTFKDGSSTLGTAPVSGNHATLSGVTTLPSGEQTITATYADTSGSFAASVSTVTPKSVINNFAGSTYGDGGPAVNAELNGPEGLADDAAGDIFIADSNNHLVREINHATGIITTVAGDGNFGYTGDNGLATSAELWTPAAVAVNSAGTLLFIADSFDSVVREVNLTTGIITTVAGDNKSGYSGDGGQAVDAELSGPMGLALNSAGTSLFISDTGNNRIREVNLATGVIMTIAGNGTAGFAGDGGAATAGELDSPEGIALDSSGNLFIADTSNQRVREWVAGSGVITTVAGSGSLGYSGDGGAATSAGFFSPTDVVLDGSNDLFISDNFDFRVREVNHLTGIITTVAGDGKSGTSGDGGQATAAELNSPQGLAFDASGDLYIADNSFGDRVREVHPSGEITTAAGNGSTTYVGDNGPALTAVLDDPTAIEFDAAGDMFFADAQNHVVREVIAATGVIETVAGNGSFGSSGNGGPATAAELWTPSGLAIDSAGDLFIADSTENTVREVNHATGVISLVAGAGAAGYGGDGGLGTAAKLSSPAALAINASGDLFIADTGNNRVREVNLANDMITTFAGTGTAGFSGDAGQAASAELNGPEGLAVDSKGDLFIADSSNARIREVSAATGVITTVAGSSGIGDAGDGGAATSATLFSPVSVAVDSSGDIFIDDKVEDKVREVNNAGVINTVAGSGTNGYSGDGGAGPAAELNFPAGIGVDPAGNLYIADSGNSRIREESVGAQIDVTASPVATLTSTPKAISNSSSATFAFTGSETGLASSQLTFKVSLDGGAFATATSPVKYTSLADGTHTFAVEAIDPAGTVGAAVSYTWQIDTTPPTSSITAFVDKSTSLTSLPVSWSGTDNSGSGIATYTIYVSTDGGAYTAWMSNTTETSATYTAAIGHAYAFKSQATDNAGNVETAHSTADATITTAQHPWHNSSNPLDVLGRGTVTPLDALAVIDYINANGLGPLPASVPVGSYDVDVAGTNNLTPLDLLQIIDYLNAHIGDESAVADQPATAFAAASGASSGTNDASGSIRASIALVAPIGSVASQGMNTAAAPAGNFAATLLGASIGGGPQTKSVALAGAASSPDSVFPRLTAALRPPADASAPGSAENASDQFLRVQSIDLAFAAGFID